MSTDYYKSLTLNSLPTGFGLYTGVQVINNSTEKVFYAASMSPTTLGIDEANVSFLEDTIFLSSEKNPTSSLYSQEMTLDPAETGYFYVLQKSFNKFTSNPAAGDEKAVLTIESSSEKGDEDLPIEIFITGKRVLSFEPSPVMKKFIARKEARNNDYSLNFEWTCDNADAYVTGFNIFLSENSDFSTNAFDSPYQVAVEQNDTSVSSPLYGNYVGLSGVTFSKKITVPLASGKSVSQLYAKLVPVNGEEEDGTASYAYGFSSSSEDYNFSDKVMDGTFAVTDEGSNLKFIPSVLKLNYSVDREENFDLMNFLYKSNNNSYDFSSYSGIDLSFTSANSEKGIIYSNDKNKAAISCKRPEETVSYSVDESNSNSFNLNLIFNNVRVAGYDGKGATFTAGGELKTDSENGGDIFNFSNLSVSPNKFNYYIKLDNGANIYAGRGGLRAEKHIDAFGRATLRSYSDFFTLGNGPVQAKDNDFVTVAEDPDSLNLQDRDVFDNVGRKGRLEYFGTQGEVGKLNSVLSDGFPDIYLSIKNKDKFDNQSLIFRFRTDNLTSSVGSATDKWQNNIENATHHLKNSGNVLTVREAYGKKFYELERAGTIANARSQTKALVMKDSDNNLVSFTANEKPSYTILVYAVANESADNFKEMFGLSGPIDVHKFIDSTAYFVGNDHSKDNYGNLFYSDPFDPNLRIYNWKTMNNNRVEQFGLPLDGLPDAVGFGSDELNIRSTFSGSPLNGLRFHGGDQNNATKVFRFINPYESNSRLSSILSAKDSGIGFDLHINAQAPPYSYKYTYSQAPDFYFNPFDYRWNEIFTENSNLTDFLRKKVIKNRFYYHNLSSTVSNPGDFRVTNSSGNTTDYGSFCLFFVEMLTSVRVNLGQKEVEEKCLINGLEVSNIVWPFGKTHQFKDQNEDPRLNPTKKYIVQLHNGSYDLTDSPSAYSPVPAATNDTKLFLFDYLHGNADNIAERDLKKNEILDYLKYNYRDILLKSQSDLLIANSSTQTYKNFGLPLSHPYININYKS